MESVNLSRTLLESGKHTELDAALAMVCEADFGGQPRFPLSAQRELQKVVVTQNYGTALFELIHFLWLGKQSNPLGWAHLIWSQPVLTTSSFRSAFGGQGQSVEVLYEDGVFEINYSRMPFLAALAEFVISACGYEPLDNLVANTRCLKDSGNAANALSRELYSYLQKYLPTLQSQRKFQRLSEFFEARYGARFTPAIICEADILDYWLAFSVKPAQDSETSADAKTFEGVYRDFVKLHQALVLGEAKLQGRFSSTLGSDFEAGEVNIEHLQPDDRLTSLVLKPMIELLDSLGDAPLDRLKLISEKEKELLRLLMESGDAALQWPLSLLRALVFGHAQRRITQALRRKVMPAQLVNLCSEYPNEDYEQRNQKLEKVAQRLRQSELACFYAVYRAAGLEISSQDIKPYERAYTAINRQGFEPDPETDAARMEAFEGAVEVLAPLYKRLEEWLSTARKFEDEQFEADARLFAHHFSQIYLGVPDENLA